MDQSSVADLISFGQELGKKLDAPAVIELIGDVGSGKTTLTRGIAKGLGIIEPISSPSFTISKHYAYTKNNHEQNLVHYDFYRLPDPGLMMEDLAESLSDPNTITIIEWADTVADILPENRIVIKITLNDNDSRHLEIIDKTKNQKSHVTEKNA
ncbi:tRNA (adenosine(37)-N6)-threonylcarbamoyltransferase complex ATPase subunit type 1 TsaE [Candidatus Saccharibacteria bacterium]|nr:tRNA (adenosine(37)-N6)-threonylcarbamoyltransferase complex ATPase subunit type 1 TsaE [Candidatus Saccharibacteria bacterium]